MKKVFYSAWILILLFFHPNSFGQYQTYVSPSNRILDISNTVVGSTAGNFAVNNFGEATYSIPIFCSPGTAGLVPDIRIVYNSNYRNGLLGIGWDIAGLSTINRVPKNYYNDSAIDGVDLASTDRFALDSNRLILTNGTYGANLSEYRTELETFAKITANGTAGTGPSWFKVETKDGNTIEYGNTSDSKVEAYGSSTVYKWRINKITDRFGNYMTFTYNEINGESYISRIDYTGNTPGWQPYNALKFIYAQRTDKNFNYVGGKKVPSTVVLSEIRMETEGALSHKYVFKYFQDFLNRSYLNEVIEYGSDGSRFNSTIFGWPALNSTNFSLPYYSNGIKNNYYFGNFVREGYNDFIIVPKKTTYYQTDKWKLYQGYNDFVYEDTVGTNFENVVIADSDGDGIDNIYIQKGFNYTYNCNPHPCGTIQSTSPSSSNSSTLLIIPSDTCWDVCTTYEKRLFAYEYDPQGGTMVRESGSDIIIPNSPNLISTIVADLDGNGKDEIIVFDGYKNLFRICGIMGSNYPNLNYPNDVKILDFDGDGRDELLVIKDNSSKIYQYENTTQQFVIIYSSTSFPTKDDRLFIGDFNGDHKDDILAYKSGWSVKYSTGTGFITGSNTPALRTYDPNASLLDNNYYIGDFDGDGLSDIAEIYKVSPTSVIRYFYSKGETFSGGFSYTFNKSNINQDYFIPVRMPVGEYDKLFYYDYSLATNTPSVVGLLSTAFDPRMTQINDGLNRSIEIAYKPLGYNLVYDWSGFVSNYPLRTLMGRHYVVESVATSTGVLSGSGTEIKSTETYSYKGLRYNAIGKGLMGFEELIINESETQLGVYKTFSIDPATFYVYPSKVALKKMSGDTAFILTNHLAKVNFPNNVFYPYFDIISTNDALKDDITIITQHVDDYGNTTLL